MFRELVKLAAQRALGAARARLLKTDPKVLTSAVTSAVTWVVVNVGLNVADPVVAAALPIVVGAIVGVLTPNAASHLDNRWRKP